MESKAVDGSRCPSIPVTEVADDAGLAGYVKQGFAELAGDANVTGCEVHIAEGVLEDKWLEGTGIKLSSRKAVTDNV